jgi:hypothetical protein
MTKLVVLAAAAAFTMMTWQAQAAPVAAKQIYQSNAVTLVGAVCGGGWHWSPALKRCVRN